MGSEVQKACTRVKKDRTETLPQTMAALDKAKIKLPLKQQPKTIELGQGLKRSIGRMG